MGLTYADVPLILEDPGHEIQDWLNRYLSLDDLRLFSPPLGLMAGRTAARQASTGRVALPVFNWPAPPRPKLNTLWWPTGASRWGVGLFLVDTDRLNQIREVDTVARYGHATLKMTEISSRADAVEDGLSFPEMYLLPARPLGGPMDSDESTDLHLLPLVDKRYWWQFMDADQLEITEASPISTWDDVLTQIQTWISTGIAKDDIDADYVKADYLEMTRQYENAAVLLDAVAASIGQRVVFQRDGTLKLQSWSGTASSLREAADYKSRIAGNESFRSETNNLLPGGVNVVFPKSKQEKVDPLGSLYAITVTAAAYTDHPTVPGTYKTVFSTAHADFCSPSGGPSNQAQLLALAQQIARDYYGWAETGGDVTWAGLQDYQLTGFDDFCWWHFAYQRPRLVNQYPWEDDPEHLDGDYGQFTRVCCFPDNFGASQNLSQFNFYDPSTDCIFSLTTALSGGEGASADAVFVRWDGAAWTETDEVLTVYDPTGESDGAAGQRGLARFDWESCRWIVLAPIC